MFYYGPPLTLPHVSYSAALDVNGVPDDFFTGKVVFIGARPMVGGFSELRDEHRSPFRGWADKVPGVEVHATEMLNLIRGDWLRRLSGEQELIWLCLFALVISWGIFQVRPLPALGVAVFAEVLVVSLATAGFVLHHCWFPFLLVSAMQIPVALTSSVLVQSIEWYRQKKALELQRREADRKIHQQAALIDKAQDAIVVENLNGEVVYANPSAVKLYGWSIEDLQPSGAGAEVFAPLSPPSQPKPTSGLRKSSSTFWGTSIACRVRMIARPPSCCSWATSARSPTVTPRRSCGSVRSTCPSRWPSA